MFLQRLLKQITAKDQKEYCIEAAGNCSAVMCHAFQAQVFSHKDSALSYSDGRGPAVNTSRSSLWWSLFG